MSDGKKLIRDKNVRIQALIDELVKVKKGREEWKAKAHYWCKEREAALDELVGVKEEREDWKTKARTFCVELILTAKEREEAARGMETERQKMAEFLQRYNEEREDWKAKAHHFCKGEARATPLTWRQLWEDFLCLLSLR